MSRSAIADWPVMKFRPEQVRPDFADRNWLRYEDATDSFIPDNGRPAVAFVGKVDGAPYALYASVPYRENIIAGGHDPKFLWHYETRDGKPDMGDPYADRDLHPNERASRRAMDQCCSLYGCANGRSVEMSLRLAAEEFSTRCAWCAKDLFGHRKDAALQELAKVRSALRYCDDREGKIRSELRDIERLRKELLQDYGAVVHTVENP